MTFIQKHLKEVDDQIDDLWKLRFE